MNGGPVRSLAVASVLLALAAGEAVAGSVVANGLIDIAVDSCSADSPLGGAGGNVVISSGLGDARIHFAVTGSGRVNAVCHFVDVSGVVEDRAETAAVENCTIVLPDGAVVAGSGHVTASSQKANKDPGEGGNATLHCSGLLP